MINDKFAELVKEIKESEKEFTMTPRELLNSFGCEKRTKWNLVRIDSYLAENFLITEPDYTSSYIDGEIILRHKKKARSKKEIDPIQRLKLLPAANRTPISISRDAQLKEAITLMMMHNFSQLPVMTGSRTVLGVITWESIGYGLTNGCNSTLVKDYIKKEIEILDYDLPLLDAVKKVIENEFALVKKADNTISGFVTIADVSTQFLNVTEPFLLLEQIENHIRLLLDGKFLLEEMKEFCSGDGDEREIQFIDDLTFGNYLRIIEKPENWERLNLSIERGHFIKQLDKVREIRNDVMHFDPEGITNEQRADLIKMAKFLMELRKFI